MSTFLAMFVMGHMILILSDAALITLSRTREYWTRVVEFLILDTDFLVRDGISLIHNPHIFVLRCAALGGPLHPSSGPCPPQHYTAADVDESGWARAARQRPNTAELPMGWTLLHDETARWQMYLRMNWMYRVLDVNDGNPYRNLVRKYHRSGCQPRFCDCMQSIMDQDHPENPDEMDELASMAESLD